MEKTGACMSRDACFSDGGVNVLYKDFNACEEGTVYCTVTVSKGKIKGCFTPDLCETETEPEAATTKEPAPLNNEEDLLGDIKPEYQPSYR
jgi:hypothetical protein